MPSRYQLPPSPCETCPHGPSGACGTGARMPGTRYGCIPWTEWYRIAWREVCALLRGEELPPRAEPVPPPAVRSPRPKPPPKEPRPPGPRHEYYLEHREKMLAQSRAYKEAHQEELREKRRADYVRKKGADK